ncbi:hypothetical protein, partial [Caballeronia terrestris]|uniref:hypothetical protein n=1 Tax=Caballeronia terrestris TaxID=1226301 RepID=UPI001F2489EB
MSNDAGDQQAASIGSEAQFVEYVWPVRVLAQKREHVLKEFGLKVSRTSNSGEPTGKSFGLRLPCALRKAATVRPTDWDSPCSALPGMIWRGFLSFM